MRFSWDEQKSRANLSARGFDFEFASLVFSGPTLERLDTRRDYGERRTIAVGRVAGVTLTVVYTDRPRPGTDPERRIIAAWRSSRRERQAYAKAIGGS